MRFYTTAHQFYGGIDLQARSMAVCVLSHDGELVLHRTMQAAPEAVLKAVAPDREGLVVAVACLFTWYGLAELWAEQGLPVVLGHALSMRASHGGQATHDTIAAHKMAALLRGGMLPQASVSPAQRRATRDRLRRRTHLRRQRSALLSQVHTTTSQDTRPEIGKKLASKATRAGVAERLSDPAVHKTLGVDLTRITHDDALLKALAREIRNPAKHHEAKTLDRFHTVSGSGTILSLVWLAEMHQIERFPSVQDFASDARLGKGRTASGGQRVGTAGKNIGHAPRTWAFSEAALLCLRTTPQGQKLLRRRENQHDTGHARSLRAQNLGRAIDDRRTRQTAVDMDLCLRSSGSRAGEAGASLDS